MWSMAKSSQGDMLFTAILGLCDGLLYEVCEAGKPKNHEQKTVGFCTRQVDGKVKPLGRTQVGSEVFGGMIGNGVGTRFFC